MLCDNCKKNEATILIKELHNGQTHTMNLCAECAKLKEEQGELGALGINLGELFFNLDKFKNKLKAAADKKAAAESGGDGAVLPACPECGWTPEQLRDSGGKLGCPECYHTFGRIIDEALGKIQRGPVHIGKRPKGGSGGVQALEFELEKLRHELQEFVRHEEYESAAVCRDRINQLRAELEKHTSEKDES